MLSSTVNQHTCVIVYVVYRKPLIINWRMKQVCPTIQLYVRVELISIIADWRQFCCVYLYVQVTLYFDDKTRLSTGDNSHQGCCLLSVVSFRKKVRRNNGHICRSTLSKV